MERKRLLILGAGGHGKVVGEIARACGFTEVKYLDDNSEMTLGKISDLPLYRNQFTYIALGIGNNEVRQKLYEEATKLGYSLPILIHPSAYVSSSAVVLEGSVIEPKACVNANSNVGKGCIISIGAIVDHDVIIGDYVHINAGAIAKAGSHIDALAKIDAGQVVGGF